MYMYVINNRSPAYDEYSTERPLWDSGDMGRHQQHPQWDSGDMERQQQHGAGTQYTNAG